MDSEFVFVVDESFLCEVGEGHVDSLLYNSFFYFFLPATKVTKTPRQSSITLDIIIASENTKHSPYNRSNVYVSIVLHVSLNVFMQLIDLLYFVCLLFYDEKL